MVLKTFIFTILSLIAFAANSVLCRLALAGNDVDPAGFTIFRLVSGAIVLIIIIHLTNSKPKRSQKGSWAGGFMLFLYAASFSFAYISLDTGTGALILFGAVQITMIVWAFFKGDRLFFIEWIGVIIAFSGFIYLILPGISAPSPIGFLLMTIAGIAWGIYSLIGRLSKDPLIDTTYNFIRSLPFLILLFIIFIKNLQYSYQGVLLATLSGSIASGIGYTLWYLALNRLSATQAAVFQLFVPVIAAFGGVMFISETITWRLLFSSLLILGGIFLLIIKRKVSI